MVWGRQSTSTVFFVAIWAAYTGFLFLNVAIEEAIGVQAPLETQEVVNNYKVVMSLPDNETYVILQGDGWRVDTGDNESVVEFGWSYVTAPIVYEGPGEPCWFEPPIRAVCAQRSPSPESCFFEPVGRDTVIRRAEEVEYFESFIVDKMPLAGGSRGQLFEFNAKPRSSLVDYVS
eukprot:gene22732-34813_t